MKRVKRKLETQGRGPFPFPPLFTVFVKVPSNTRIQHAIRWPFGLIV